MTNETVAEITGLLGYPDAIPEELLTVIKNKAVAVDQYLTEIGVPEEKKTGDMYKQVLALGVNDLMGFDSSGFSGLFERMSVTLR